MQQSLLCVPYVLEYSCGFLVEAVWGSQCSSPVSQMSRRGVPSAEATSGPGVAISRGTMKLEPEVATEVP